MTETIKFACCYCRTALEARPEQVECMIQCAECGRSVLTPLDPATARWTTPVASGMPRRGLALVVAIVSAIFGGLLVGGIAFGLFYSASLAVIGIGISEAITVGCIGFVVGGFGFGILAWNVCTR